MDNNQTFFVGQKAIVVNNKQEVLVLITPANGIDFPGGQIQNGEANLMKSLKREVMEETKIEISVGKLLSADSIDFKDKNVFFVFYLCDYISGEVTLSNEHISYTWVNKGNYTDFKDNSIWFSVLEKYFQETIKEL